MEKFERITRVRLPFDRRHSDPSKNYGIHGLDVYFILKGEKGAAQFAVNFPVFLPHVEREHEGKFPKIRKEILGIDVGYHSPVPTFEGQNAMRGDCDVIGGKCYYDGSGLRADDWVQELFSVRGEHIDKLVWKKLEEEYADRFERNAEVE